MSVLNLSLESVRLWKNAFKSQELTILGSEEAFRKTTKYAFEHTAFYPAFWAKKGFCPKDLDSVEPPDIPILTKQDIRDYCEDPSCDGTFLNSQFKRFLSKKPVIIQSSGSTGLPTKFLYSQKALTTVEANFIRLSNLGGKTRVGFRDLPVRALHAASIGDGYASSVLLSEGLSKYHARCLLLNTTEPLGEWPGKIADFQPNYLSGYPSCLSLLLKLQMEGKIKLDPLKIISGGEPLTKALKRDLQEVFKADVVDFYGCSESLLLGAGSSWYEGIYLFDDMNYTEIDREGHLIITPLYNLAMPLIRYKLDDIVCGFTRSFDGPLPFTHIDKIIGRDNDILWFINEVGARDFLHPLALDDIIADGLKEFQIVRMSDWSFRVDCIADHPSGNTKTNISRQLDDILEKKHMKNVRYEIRFCAHLKRNARSGKVPLTVSTTAEKDEV